MSEDLIPNQKSGVTYPNASPLDGYNIQAHANYYEGLLRRHGQAARVIQVVKCACSTNGHPDIYCTVCSGLGYTYNYQKNLMVVDENSPRNDKNVIFPFGTPITKVVRVQRAGHPKQGGMFDLNVVAVTTEKIYVDGPFLKRQDPLRVTYEYGLEQSVVGENPKREEAGYIMQVTGSETSLRTSNPFKVRGDITSVSRVYNVTTDVTYTVKKFEKQTIVVDDEDGDVDPIAITDVLEVDYKYIAPQKVATGRITKESPFNVEGEELMAGDCQGIFTSGLYLNKGDIITLLSSRLREDSVLVKTDTDDAAMDEIPQFDVVEILRLVDQDGVSYTYGTDFYLSHYNNIKWIVAGAAPAKGKKYTVSYLYRPSYRIYRQAIDTINNEDKYFPSVVMLRFMNKFTKKDLVKL